MQARFWVWHKGGFVRLKIDEGKALTFVEGGPTDEGYHWEYSWYMNMGDCVRYERDTESRDCDGRLDTHQAFYCRVDNLDGLLSARYDKTPELDIEGDHAYDEVVSPWRGTAKPKRVPLWTRIESRQRDYSAEAMGY